MRFDVVLSVRPPDEVGTQHVSDVLAQVGDGVGAEVEDDLVRVRVLVEIPSDALPEVIRAAQARLSVELRSAIPEYAERGGLVWRDIVRASIASVSH